MKAQNNNIVKIHYRGTLTNGSVFDESVDREPLEFTIGAGMVIPGFEKQIIGMKVGEKKTIFIPAEDAYGKHSDELIIELPKENIADDLSVEVGDVLQLQLTPENIVNIEVIEIKENTIVIDANHKLADKDLNFDIELIGIK